MEVSEVENAIKHLDINMDMIWTAYKLNTLNIVISPLCLHFAMYITGFFVHYFLPNAFLSVVLVPIVKDKCGKINS